MISRMRIGTRAEYCAPTGLLPINGIPEPVPANAGELVFTPPTETVSALAALSVLRASGPAPFLPNGSFTLSAMSSPVLLFWRSNADVQKPLVFDQLFKLQLAP